MAEFCKECFINILQPSEDDIANIVISKEPTLCEGCGKINLYVEYIKDKN